MQVNEIWPDWHGNSDTFSLARLCSCIDYLLLIICILQMMFPSASSFPPYNKHFKADNCNETRVLSSAGVSCYLSPPLLSQFCSLCSTPYTPLWLVSLLWSCEVDFQKYALSMCSSSNPAFLSLTVLQKEILDYLVQELYCVLKTEALYVQFMKKNL